MGIIKLSEIIENKFTKINFWFIIHFAIADIFNSKISKKAFQELDDTKLSFIEISNFFNKIIWRGGIYVTNIFDYKDQSKILKWSHNNLSSKTKIILDIGTIIFFRTKEDTIAFKMRWL